jgi:hypothetical protein
LARGEDGSLWAGTDDSGLARRDKDGRWQTYSQARPRGGVPDDRIQALVFGTDGSLWAGTFGGLVRLDKDGHWQTYDYDSSHGGLPDDDVQALALGADGSLWAGTFGGGLARLDKDGRWQTYNHDSTQGGLPDNHIWALARGADGSVWVGTESGLARLDMGGHWQTYNNGSTQGGLPDDFVSALALGAGGLLWVGTENGLARLDQDGHWQTYSEASTQGGLPDNSVSALVADETDGSLWVGTDRGLANLRRPLGRTLRIVDVIGKVGEVTQGEQTIAVSAFDDSYLTQPGMFHYIWRLSEMGLPGTTLGPEIKTRSSVYRAFSTRWRVSASRRRSRSLRQPQRPERHRLQSRSAQAEFPLGCFSRGLAHHCFRGDRAPGSQFRCTAVAFTP